MQLTLSKHFSAAVTAHKHGVLCCEGSYAHQAVEKIGADGESIVIINNFLANGWINRLPEILYKKMFFMCLPTRMQKTFRLNLKACMDSCCHCLQSSWWIKKLLVNTMVAISLTILNPIRQKKARTKNYQSFRNCSEFVSEKQNQQRCGYDARYLFLATADDDFLFCVFPIAYASMAVT